MMFSAPPFQCGTVPIARAYGWLILFPSLSLLRIHSSAHESGTVSARLAGVPPDFDSIAWRADGNGDGRIVSSQWSAGLSKYIAMTGPVGPAGGESFASTLDRSPGLRIA